MAVLVSIELTSFSGNMISEMYVLLFIVIVKKYIK